MALATYSDLTSAITSWMYSRSDIAANADDFIDLAEANINFGIEDPMTKEIVKLRCRDMETTAEITPDAEGHATLPTDFLEWRQVTSTDNPRRDLKLVAPSYAEDHYGYRESDLPEHFDIVGTELRIYPVSTTIIELIYYAKVAALSSTNTTNWLFTKFPNIYLDGCLYHASKWLRNNPEDTIYFQGEFIKGIRSLSETDKAARWARHGTISSGQRP
jgi:hypothetical protein